MFISQKASEYLFDRFKDEVQKWPIFQSVEQMLKEAHITFWTEELRSGEHMLCWRVDSNFTPAMDPRHDWDWVKHSTYISDDTCKSKQCQYKLNYLFKADDAKWLRGKVVDFFECDSMDMNKNHLYLVSWIRED